MQRIFALLFWILPVWASHGWAQQASDRVAPEAAVQSAVQSAVLGVDAPEVAAAQARKAAGLPTEGQDWMISVANPLAAQAGARVLAAGGTAADAMVAAQAVLGLVEPQSSGLGGGAFLLWHDGATGKITSLDARETAPLSATPKLFQDAEGKPLKFFEAVLGGRSVGVPGVPALMEEAHKRWGRQAWPTLFEPAIGLAEAGFVVSPRLAGLVARDQERLATHPQTAAYFLPNGVALAEGSVLIAPHYAKTLRILAEEGAAGFYTGEIAREIVAAVSAGANRGDLSLLDLAAYKVKERNPICIDYRGFEVCGMGPPSSGGIAVAQILGMLAPFDMTGLGATSAQSWRLIGDASRLAFADRGRYLADEDFVPVPTTGLVERSYVWQRAELLKGTRALDAVEPGNPKWDHAMDWGVEATFEQASTTHLSIVDGYGNALSMTSSIENAFGSRVMVAGFLLNNQLTDFSFSSQNDGVPVANRVEPGKRPRSSMAPTIVRQNGKPVLVLGSPGGSQIIGYVAQAIIGWVDWGMTVQEAVAQPHLSNRFGTFEIEAETSAVALAPELEGLGYQVKMGEMTSGLQAIALGEADAAIARGVGAAGQANPARPARLTGGADPRREGVAIGQ